MLLREWWLNADDDAPHRFGGGSKRFKTGKDPC
jgi:hypothetical protein